MQVLADIKSAKSELKRINVKSDKEVKVLADVIYETLKNEGCEANDIILLATKLIEQVTTDISVAPKS